MSQIVRDMCNKHNVAETLHIKRYNPWIKTKIIAGTTDKYTVETRENEHKEKLYP